METAAKARLTALRSHLAPSSTATASPPPPAALAPLQARVAELVASGRLHGCSFAVAREGAVVFAGCAGTTPAVDGEGGLLPAGTPINTETIFITASVTKPLAGIAIMQLVEAGRLSLDAPLVSLLPAFAGGDKGLVTVRHLLCHTSGIPDSVAGVDRTTHPTLSEHTAATCEMELLFRPGTNVSYSSAAFNMLAEVVHAVSGQLLPEYLRDRVFAPLGLSDTTLGLEADRQPHRESPMNREVPTGMNGEQLFPNKDSLAIAKEVARREEGGGGGGYAAFGHNSVYWRNLGAAWAGLLTTPSDMATLYQVLVGGGQLPGGARILKEQTVRDMIRCHTHGDDASVMLDEDVRRGGNIFGDAPPSHWGLSFRLNAGDRKFGPAGRPVVFGHHGGAGAMVWADPVSGVSFACLTTEPTMCCESPTCALAKSPRTSSPLLARLAPDLRVAAEQTRRSSTS